MLKTEFFRKFAKPEFKSIAGKRYLNLLKLSIILVLSILAIGLGEGAIKYLNEKMNSPFVSFVNVKIPMGNTYSIDRMKEIHKKDHSDVNFYDYYGFKEPYAVYDRFGVNFTNFSSDITKSAKVRMGRENDPVYDFIKNFDPITTIDNDFDFDGWGCVVSLEFLKKDKTKLMYNDTADVAYLHYRRQIDKKHEYICIPIQGIVKSFPDDVDMIIGEKFFDATMDPDYWPRLAHPDSSLPFNGYMQYYIIDNEELLNYLVANDFQEIEIDGISHNKGKMYKKSKLTKEEKLNLVNNLPDPDLSNAYNVLDFDLVNSPRKDVKDEELFVFEFYKDKLNKIGVFNSFLKEKTIDDGESLKIDMRVMESKNNFDLFNKLANLLSYALIFFSIFSIVLYITNLIVSHISKNKKNLGTLKAFGLSNNNIILIYSTISFTLIAISFVLSLIVSALVGNSIVLLVAKYFEIGDASSLNYVSYPIYWLLLFFIILPSIFIYWELWRKLRGNTPGDLIYERESK